jgi:methionine synthase II (cobalamin-independent)
LVKTDAARSKQLHEEAKAAYAALVEKHPDAFADHAARFLLKDEPAIALPLALRNLKLRQTTEAYDLALDASLAAGDSDQACRVAKEARARPHAPPRLIQRADRVIHSC